MKANMTAAPNPDPRQSPGDRIPTTHVGSLPRPDDLVALLVARDSGEDVDEKLLAEKTAAAVNAAVTEQVDCGIDIVSDGEMGKISYVNYVKHRLDGFGAPAPLEWDPADLVEHPEYKSGRRGTSAGGEDPPACRGPVSPKDRGPLDEDITNFTRALDPHPGTVRGFLNAASPGVVAHFMPNRYYPSHEAYVEALADALADEYEAIHAAGFLLQIDCPDLAMARHMAFADDDLSGFRRAAAFNVDALNHATRNIPPDAMRLHICWGNYPGPHTHDVPLRDIADIVFGARPRHLLFEAANPTHAHEWEDWAEFQIPDDLVLVPGVIETTNNRVEHPRLIAQRLLRFADIVGRERVIAGTDCGFSTMAGLPRVWPSVAWKKLRALAEGARLATDQLW